MTAKRKTFTETARTVVLALAVVGVGCWTHFARQGNAVLAPGLNAWAMLSAAYAGELPDLDLLTDGLESPADSDASPSA